MLVYLTHQVWIDITLVFVIGDKEVTFTQGLAIVVPCTVILCVLAYSVVYFLEKACYLLKNKCLSMGRSRNELEDTYDGSAEPNGPIVEMTLMGESSLGSTAKASNSPLPGRDDCDDDL